ncbi:MAG: DNA repair protein RadC [Chitinispirillia bacterium]|jgi:DNA repair protein RadC
MICHNGHRKRLLDRFKHSGLKGFHNYEIIELLLTFVISRKDTKPVAKDLLSHYKTISAILNADFKEIEQFHGIGMKSALFLTLIREIIAYCLCEKYEHKSIVSHRKHVEEYLRFHFGMRKDEYIAVIFLDNGNRIIATEELASGTVNQCVVYPRTVIEKALKYGSSSFIMAHNHPGGNSDISEADWNITEKIHTVGKILNILLLDHILILKNRTISLREFSRWPK